MRLGALAVVVVGGCGRIAFDPLGDGSENPAAPWSAPEEWAISPSGDDPALSQDMLEMYLNTGSVDLVRTTRASKADVWSASAVVSELDVAAAQASPELSYDGLTLYFGSGRVGSLGSKDLWMSTRASLGAPWGVPAEIAELSSTLAEHPGCLSVDQLTIVLDSNRVAGTDDDLFIASRTSITAAWGAPTLLASLDVPGFDDESPCLTADGLGLYFDSNRSGLATLYFAQRQSSSDDFGTPVVIDVMDTGAPQYDPWVSADGHDLVFYSGGSMWHSTR
jgi:hypothetical protein